MMLRSIGTLGIVSLCAVALALCCSTGEPISAEKPEPTAPDALMQEIYIPKDAQLSVDWAINDLASRLDVASDNIKTTEVSQTEWSNSSLGCPSAGQMYAQVITPGYVIKLESGGQTWEYHTALGSSMAKFCGVANSTISSSITKTAI